MATKRKQSRKPGGERPKIQESGAKLTTAQIRFVDIYMNCMNATKAYEEAGFEGAHPGQRAHELRKHPEVHKEIEWRFAQERDGLRDAYRKSLEKLKKIALADAYAMDGQTIASWSETEKGRSVKMIDPLKAIEMLAKLSGEGDDLSDTLTITFGDDDEEEDS